MHCMDETAELWGNFYSLVEQNYSLLGKTVWLVCTYSIKVINNKVLALCSVYY